MDVSAAEIVTKVRFAALKNVSKGRVSQWIAEKKIKGPALVGKGRNARINVTEATIQLRQTLDIGQRAGRGINTDLSLPAAVSVPAPAVAPAPVEALAAASPVSSAPAVDPIEEHIKRERLEQLRRSNRKLAEEEAARAGRFTDAAESSRRMGFIAAQTITIVEGSLSEIATALSAKFQIPQRDVLHLLHAELRKVRAAGAKMFREQAEVLPAMVEVEVELEEKEIA